MGGFAPYRESTDPNYVLTLCRLLADPKKVRVSIRRIIHENDRLVLGRLGSEDERERLFARPRAHDHLFFVFIAPRDCPTRGYSGLDARPERALLKALMLAQEGHMDGVDLSMSCSFPHPQGRIIDREAEAEDRRLMRYLARLINGDLTE